jgi:hypothetical protein
MLGATLNNEKKMRKFMKDNETFFSKKALKINEANFLKMLQVDELGNASGLTLYRGDATGSKWTKLGLNGAMVKEFSCF